MDEATPTQPTQANQTPTQSPKKSGNFFAIFGKIMLGVVIVGLLLFGGYYLGTRNNKTPKISITPTPAQTMEKTISPTSQTTPISPTKASTKTIKGGLTNDSTSFKPYSVEIPTGWTDVRDTTDITDKLTISKNGYSLTIYQAPFGGGGCLYKGDPDTPMAQSYTDYVQIAGTNTQYRRSWNTVGQYTICQKHPSENSYGSPTTYGAISAKSPSPADSTIMAEIDGMIASLIAQN